MLQQRVEHLDSPGQRFQLLKRKSTPPEGGVLS
jgi:hypothetical protein